MASGKYRAAKQKQAFLHNQRQILGTRIIIKNGVILSFLRDRHCLTRYTLYAPAHPTHSELRLRGSSTRVSLLLYPQMDASMLSPLVPGGEFHRLCRPSRYLSNLTRVHHWFESPEPAAPLNRHPLRTHKAYPPHHQLVCKVRNSQRSLQRAGQLSNSMIGAVKVEPTRLVLWIWLSPSVAKVELLTRSVSIYRNVCMWVCMHKDVRRENYLLWRWRRPDQFRFAPLIHQLMKRKVATC